MTTTTCLQLTPFAKKCLLCPLPLSFHYINALLDDLFMTNLVRKNSSRRTVSTKKIFLQKLFDRNRWKLFSVDRVVAGKFQGEINVLSETVYSFLIARWNLLRGF